MRIAKTIVLECMSEMFTSNRQRAINVNARPALSPVMLPPAIAPQSRPPPPMRINKASASVATITKPPLSALPPPATLDKADQVDSSRDAGVTDATWAQLQLDRQEQESVEREHLALKERERLALIETKRLEYEALSQLRLAKDLAERQHAEQLRLRAAAEMRKRDEAARALEKQETARRVEAEVQSKLREMGVCVAGFRWIKQSGGYRCAGGSHFISNSQLGI